MNRRQIQISHVLLALRLAVVFVVLFALSANQIASAQTVAKPSKRFEQMRGRFFFDHAHPHHAACLQVNREILERYGKLRLICRFSAEGGYSQTAKGEIYVCERGQVSWMVAESFEACEQNLEAELFNGT